MEKKTNWKAWASVAASTFIGAAAAFYAMPHEGKASREMLVGALLAGLSAVIHLLQKPQVVVAAAAVEEKPAEKKTAGDIVAEKAKDDAAPVEPVVVDSSPVDTQGGP